MGTGPAVKPLTAYLERIRTHLVELPNAPVCVICSLLQGNVRPCSLSRAALHKTEKGGYLKGRDGTGFREFAGWVDCSCSYCASGIASPQGSTSSCWIFLISASSVSLRSFFFQGKIPKPYIPFSACFQSLCIKI